MLPKEEGSALSPSSGTNESSANLIGGFGNQTFEDNENGPLFRRWPSNLKKIKPPGFAQLDVQNVIIAGSMTVTSIVGENGQENVISTKKGFSVIQEADAGSESKGSRSTSTHGGSKRLSSNSLSKH